MTPHRQPTHIRILKTYFNLPPSSSLSSREASTMLQAILLVSGHSDGRLHKLGARQRHLFPSPPGGDRPDRPSGCCQPWPWYRPGRSSCSRAGGEHSVEKQDSGHPGSALPRVRPHLPLRPAAAVPGPRGGLQQDLQHGPHLAALTMGWRRCPASTGPSRVTMTSSRTSVRPLIVQPRPMAENKGVPRVNLRTMKVTRTEDASGPSTALRTRLRLLWEARGNPNVGVMFQ